MRLTFWGDYSQAKRLMFLDTHSQKPESVQQSVPNQSWCGLPKSVISLQIFSREIYTTVNDTWDQPKAIQWKIFFLQRFVLLLQSIAPNSIVKRWDAYKSICNKWFNVAMSYIEITIIGVKWAFGLSETIFYNLEVKYFYILCEHSISWRFAYFV